MQTPQVFRYKDIYNAHMKALMDGWDEVTDDALLMEKMNIPVKIIPGSEENIKITTPFDLEYAEFLLRKGFGEG
ncbi:2-C-methyl-D-erythritol 4-phosphate cytidylyltransferase [Thermodesulfobacteriota bacterium]